MMLLPLYLLQGYVLLAVGYLLFPLIGALLTLFFPPAPLPPGACRRNFAILIPAHNEEQVLGKLLDSIRAQDYPTNCYTVFVVADNCQDRTMEVAQAHGAQALVRQTDGPSTKSQALRFLWTHLDPTPFDAVVILDADNLVSAKFLQAIDTEMEARARVVQGMRRAKNPFETKASRMDYLTEAVSHRIGGAGRRYFGLSSTIAGSGVAYQTSVFSQLLNQTPDTLVEDCAWQLQLMMQGIPIRWSPEAVVFDEKTNNLKALTVQRTRWLSGKYRLIPSYFPRFLKALLQGKPQGLAGIMYLLTIPPRSLFLILSLGFALLALLGCPGMMPAEIWLGVVALWGVYLIVGLKLEEAPLQAYTAVLFLPVLIGRVLWASLLALRPRVTWIPTAHHCNSSISQMDQDD